MGAFRGGYSRWDDLVWLTHQKGFGDPYYKYFDKEKHIVLVEPCELFERKRELFRQWKEWLESMGVRVEILDKMQVPDDLSSVDNILFVDEDERKGNVAQNILGARGDWSRAFTYKGLIEKILSSVDKEMEEEFFGYIQEMGISVLMLQCKDNGSQYSRKLRKEIREKFIRANTTVGYILPPSAEKGFFEELYTAEYAKVMQTIHGNTFKFDVSDGIIKIKNVCEKYYSVTDGERLTVGQPDSYNRTIWFFGPCFIFGTRVEDQYTIESYLQKRLNTQGMKIRVVNLGSWNTRAAMMRQIAKTPMKQGDIAVIYLENSIFSCVQNLNLEDALEQKNSPGDWFVDDPRHCNHKAYEIYAEAIYEKLMPLLETPVREEKKQLEMDENISVRIYIERYFSHFDKSAHGSIGAIVMNCNPFTYGHRYLIEEALKTVEYLIVFVVEEDKSLFSFDERFTLVKAGVADLPNVMVVPSGPCILSQTTFPEYFVKVADEDIIKNVEYDVTLFAEEIAPRLNITCRFVGEEPEDLVTNEYNKAMKRILPPRGIKLVEIPRKKNGSGIISASEVRRCLETGDLAKLDELVPESTKRILFYKNE